MELNVKQSGIARKVLIPTYFKTRAGKINKRVGERYLRSDISCGLSSCAHCRPFGKNFLCKKPIVNTNSVVTGNHALILDSSCFIRFSDLFESDLFQNLVVIQSVWENVKSKSIPAYKTMNCLCYEHADPRCFVFMNDFHNETFIEPKVGISEDAREELSLIKSCQFLEKHWIDKKVTPVVICADELSANRMKDQVNHVLTIKQYTTAMKDAKRQELLDKMAAYDMKGTTDENNLFEEHLTHDEIIVGISQGTIKKGTFNVSRENYREATVIVDNGVSWFIQGKYCNRAVHGDSVALILLPESEWTAPEKTLRLRDVEEITLKADDESNEEEPAAKKWKINTIPTAKVVGIVKRNWRSYCGILLPSVMKGARRHLFCPAERLIPRIRIETEQAEVLASQRIIVAIDRWPRDSKWPLGHYVRSLGELGDKETENEVLLLEHDIPHAPFSDSVLDCLPKDDWKPDLQPPRVDLRHLTICSVDPIGCTDIDDALHCTKLKDGLYEVGVHIADVSHFMRPNTAMDEEAKDRGTTVYLCDRRIDMIPSLLSANLCSLRGEEERYAFSVIWQMTSDAEILHTKFHKSLIKSKAALSYEKAQEMIDDTNLTDDVTTGMRGLMMLSKKLNNKRTANGALTLASSEVRFDMDWETRTPKSVQVKAHLDTHSMVEEFMLLANISVAEKIMSEYPDCALLRRHPVPSPTSYKPLIEAAKLRGFEINVESGKALADSLNRAVDKTNPMMNRLLRMLTTRCMTQAVYFATGTVPVAQYQHFGLACPIYTHFTSPIRRYADVMVHRLLAACIGADDIGAGLLSQENVKKICENINYRHTKAQYAGRASVQLNVLTFFKGRVEECEGFIMGIRTNGIQVFVPKYGLESVIVLETGKGTSIDLEASCVRSGDFIVKELDRVVVRVHVNEKNKQRPRIALDLLKPNIPGFSVEFDLSSESGLAKE